MEITHNMSSAVRRQISHPNERGTVHHLRLAGRTQEVRFNSEGQAVVDVFPEDVALYTPMGFAFSENITLDQGGVYRGKQDLTSVVQHMRNLEIRCGELGEEVKYLEAQLTKQQAVIADRESALATLQDSFKTVSDAESQLRSREGLEARRADVLEKTLNEVRSESISNIALITELRTEVESLRKELAASRRDVESAMLTIASQEKQINEFKATDSERKVAAGKTEKREK